MTNPTRSRIPRPKPKKVGHASNTRTFPSKGPRTSSATNTDVDSFLLQSPESIQPTPAKTIIPSIHDIIRAHAKDLTPTKAIDTRDSVDLISRSSIDTIAEEVQHTLRQPIPDSSPFKSQKITQNINITTAFKQDQSTNIKVTTDIDSPSISQSETIATYIRSARLTTLVKIPRPLRTPFQVSLSDLGDPNGRPVVVFLGLGAVRYIMGLYDEMAEVLGLRIITIDR
jgi:hypothetical protein